MRALLIAVLLTGCASPIPGPAKWVQSSSGAVEEWDWYMGQFRAAEVTEEGPIFQALCASNKTSNFPTLAEAQSWVEANCNPNVRN